jgi:hypothetical protein
MEEKKSRLAELDHIYDIDKLSTYLTHKDEDVRRKAEERRKLIEDDKFVYFKDQYYPKGAIVVCTDNTEHKTLEVGKEYVSVDHGRNHMLSYLYILLDEYKTAHWYPKSCFKYKEDNTNRDIINYEKGPEIVCIKPFKGDPLYTVDATYTTVIDNTLSREYCRILIPNTDTTKTVLKEFFKEVNVN